MSPVSADTLRGGRGTRHRFAPEILAAVRAASRLDDWHGPAELFRHWFWIAFWCVAAVVTFHHAPLWASVPVYLLAAFFIGGRQRALAGVLHMATHRAFMAHHRAGSILGAVFGGYPVLQSFTAYRASHLGEHHGRLGDPERDPDYRQYKDNGLCGDNLGRPALNRYLRKVVGPRSTGSYILYLLRHRVWSKDEVPLERTLRIAALVAVLGWAVAGHWWLWLVLLWFVPLVTTQVWIGAVAELMEHFPLIENAPRIDLYMSWNREYGFLTRFLFSEADGEGFHLAHHLYPRTPMWRLREVDAILANDPAYAALPRLSGVLGGMAQIYRSLPPTTRAARSATVQTAA